MVRKACFWSRAEFGDTVCKVFWTKNKMIAGSQHPSLGWPWCFLHDLGWTLGIHSLYNLKIKLFNAELIPSVKALNSFEVDKLSLLGVAFMTVDSYSIAFLSFSSGMMHEESQQIFTSLIFHPFLNDERMLSDLHFSLHPCIPLSITFSQS